MKTLSKLLAILLVLVMLFSLAACGSSKKSGKKSNRDDSSKSDVDDRDDDDDDKDNDRDDDDDDTDDNYDDGDIVGTWKTSISYNDVLYAGRNSGELPADIDENNFDILIKVFDGAYVPLRLDLNEDKTLSVYMDEAGWEDSLSILKNNIPGCIPELAAASGMTMEELEAQVKALGMTMDDYLVLITDTLSAMFQQIAQGFYKEGTYTFEGNQLHLSYEDGSYRDWTVQLSGNKLKVTNITGNRRDTVDSLLPMVFTKCD